MHRRKNMYDVLNMYIIRSIWSNEWPQNIKWPLELMPFEIIVNIWKFLLRNWTTYFAHIFWQPFILLKKYSIFTWS
jgi:hypothetical protein